MSDLSEILSWQLQAAKVPHRREVTLVPGRKFRTDILVGDLAVECDGATWANGRHSRGSGIETDSEKQCLIAMQGYRPMRVTRRQIESGKALSWIEAALSTRTRGLPDDFSVTPIYHEDKS